MGFYRSILRPLLFALPAETAHNLGMAAIRRGLVSVSPFTHPILEQEFLGIKFPNPIGLAAGFDKHAVAVNQWHRLGFGFAELGTVTWHPQPGNPKPRLFRVSNYHGLINRFGFNNEGALAVADRIGGTSPHIPIGINLGKSKVTDLANAAKDYQDSFRALHKLGAYFVVNVSSPNTPGLRSLQEKGPLLEILSAMREIDSSRPIFVKVSPDMEFDALDDVLDVARESKLTGIIATNTTISRETLPPDALHRKESGGLSGAPVRDLANATLRHLGKNSPQDLILIGVGGISAPGDIYEKIALGAHLCQIYTGWIYGGPRFVPDLLEQFVQLLELRGVKSLPELRGSAL
jgi:dihydroorotate dehydrogenase